MKTVTTSVGFQDPLGNLVLSGKLILTLSQAAEVTSGGGLIAPKVVVLPLDAVTAKIASTQLYFSDELTPTGTTYHAELLDSGGNIIADFGQWSITGASADLSTMVPTSIGGTLQANAVITNPVAQQNINGQTLNMEGASLSFSAAASTTADSFFSRLAAGVIGVGTAIGNALGTLRTAILQIGGSDTGITRDSAGVIDVGNGTQGDTSGSIKAATATIPTLNGPVTVTGNVTGSNQSLRLNNTAASGHNWQIGEVFSVSHLALRDTTQTGAGAFEFQVTNTVSALATLVNANTASRTHTLPDITGTLCVVPTVTLKKGTNAGNYSSASLTFVQVDSTNLLYTVTIPTGWKLTIAASGIISSLTAAVTVQVGIFDGGTVLTSMQMNPPGTGLFEAFALNWVIAGDGASHTIDLRYLTGNAADSVTIGNSSNFIPSMVFLLIPSN